MMAANMYNNIIVGFKLIVYGSHMPALLYLHCDHIQFRHRYLRSLHRFPQLFPPLTRSQEATVK
jgi:hypothetical protein